MPIQESSFFLNLAKELSYNIKVPLLLSLFLETLNQGQIISLFLFVRFPSSENIFTWFERFRTILLMPSFFELSDHFNSGYWTRSIWICFVTYIFLYTLALAVVGVLIKKQKQILLISKVLTILSLVHSRLLFFPMGIFFLQVIQFSINNQDFFANIGVLGLSWGCSVINFVLALVKEFLCYRIDKDKNSYGSKTNFQQKATVLFKGTSIMLFLSYTGTQLTFRAIIITGIIYCIVSIYMLYSRIPYYNLTLMQYAYTLASFVLSFALFALLNTINISDKIAIPVLFVSIPFLAIFLRSKQKILFEKILSGDFGTAERAIHLPILLKKYTTKYDTLILARKMFPLESIYFYSFLELNVQGYDSMKATKAQELINQDFYISLIRKCSVSSINYRKSEAFLLYMSKILIKKLGNTFQALTFMEEARAANSSIPVRVSIENLYISLKKVFATRKPDSENSLDLSSYFNHREELNLLKRDIRLEIQHHLDFWKEISADEINAKTIIDLADTIEDVYTKIKRRWYRNAIDFQNTYPTSMLLYGFYLDLVRDLPQESIPIIQKFASQEQNFGLKKQVDLVSETSALLIVSIERNTLGLVVDVSDTVQSVFGFSREMLLGMKINQLMPNFIATQHDKFLQRYTQVSKAQENQKVVTFAKTGNGELKEVHHELRIYPYLDRGVNLIAHVKQVIDDEEQIIITTHEGTITECSKSLQTTLKIYGMNLEDINIQEICPTFLKINCAFNTLYGNKVPGIAGDTEPNKDTQKGIVKQNTNYDELTSLMTSPMISKRDSVFTKRDSVFTKRDSAFMASPKSPLNKREDSAFMLSQPYSPHNTSSRLLPNFPKLTTEDYIPLQPSALDIVGKVQLNKKEVDYICERYQAGEKLKFYSYRKDRVQKGGELSLTVTITPHIFEGKIYKIIKVIKSNDVVDLSKRNQANIFKRRKLEGFSDSKDDSSGSSRKSDKSSESEIAEEFLSPERSRRHKKTHLDMIEYRKQEREAAKLVTEREGIVRGKKKKNILQLINTKNNRQNVLVKQNFTDRGSSQASYAYLGFKARKGLNNLFNTTKIHPLTRLSICGVYFVLLGIIASTFINFSFNHKSLNEVQVGVDVINIAGQRLNKAIVAWEWMLMFYSRLLGLRPLFSVYGYSRKYIYNLTRTMSELNRKLMTKLDSIDNEDIVQEFVVENIKFYDYPEDTISLLDSFTASNKIILPNLFIGNYSDTDAKLVKRPEFIFCTNNTANDYLVKSEGISKGVFNTVSNRLIRNTSQSLEIVLLEHVGIVLLIFSLILVAIVILRSYSKVFQATTRINNNSIKQRIEHIKNFEEIMREIESQAQTSNQNFALTNFNEKFHPKTKQKQKLKKEYSIKSYSRRSLFLNLSRYIIISILLLLIVSGIFLGLFFQSSSSFKTLGKINEQVYLIDKLKYQSVVVLANFYFCIIYQNATQMLIRNEPPLIQLDKNLNSFSQVNEQLLNIFLNKEGEIGDSFINGLLRGKLCDYLSPSMRSNCEIATEGNALGLLGINAKSLTKASQYIDLYKSNPTTENAKQLLKPYYDLSVALDLVMDATYDLLISHILSGFYIEVSALQRANLLLSLGATIIIVIAGIALQTISIRKFISLDTSQRRIFKVFTYSAFTQNKALDFLLRTEFKHEIQEIGNIALSSA